jgi:hypothetical protein
MTILWSIEIIVSWRSINQSINPSVHSSVNPLSTHDVETAHAVFKRHERHTHVRTHCTALHYIFL